MFLFWLFVEPAHYVEHDVVRDNVGPCLCPSLGVHRVFHVGDVSQYVESVDHKRQLAVQQSLLHPGIPNQLVFVDSLVRVSPA